MSDPGRPRPAFACLYAPPPTGFESAVDPAVLLELAQAFSPRYERHGDALMSMDVTGLERLMRPTAAGGGSAGVSRGGDCAWRTIGEELLRSAMARQTRLHVAVAGTRTAALVLAHARPGLTIVPPGQEAAALASVPLTVLGHVAGSVVPPVRTGSRATLDPAAQSAEVMRTFTRWALRTLGDLAALPAAALTARLGRPALVWQAIARGDDVRPLVPTEPEERFEETLDLEWPIEGLEPLSFVLTRLLEPLSTRLERRDRGAAVLHVLLALVSREVHVRHLELPSPLRDVRTLRTLALLDIEAHPPASAIDRVTVIIDPTPGRVVQHTLFTRALPTPERLSTLLARVAAVVGADRVGAPAPVDTYRPGAFAMRPFSTEPQAMVRPVRQGVAADGAGTDEGAPSPALVTALRRCRQPVPARVVVEAGRPVRVTSERRGLGGGAVVGAAGPWRTSGAWWEEARSSASGAGPWDRDEWDVALADRARYRIFRDRVTDAWFIEGMFD
ncbi:MAG: hypothetical protein AB7N65_10830 [Vicinamibacterales bacterium]